MAIIKQVSIGRYAHGAIDGIIYVTRNGITYARSKPVIPARTYTNPAARKRQAIFKMIQMHLKHHLCTIRQTFTPQGLGNPSTRYHSENNAHLTLALDALADRMVDGEVVTIREVESAICTYAAEHPKSIVIAQKEGFRKVYLNGEWPEIITLHPICRGGCKVMVAVEER